MGRWGRKSTWEVYGRRNQCFEDKCQKLHVAVCETFGVLLSPVVVDPRRNFNRRAFKRPTQFFGYFTFIFYFYYFFVPERERPALNIYINRKGKSPYPKELQHEIKVPNKPHQKHNQTT